MTGSMSQTWQDPHPSHFLLCVSLCPGHVTLALARYQNNKIIYQLRDSVIGDKIKLLCSLTDSAVWIGS